MTRHKFRCWTAYMLIAVTVSVFGFHSISALAQDGDKIHVYKQPVKTHPSQGEVRTINGAMARLVTTREGAFVNLATRDLAPGHVYTLWWVVINQPEACATAPCRSPDVLKSTAKTNSDVTYGDGIVVNSNGRGSFNGFLATGNMPNSWFGNGYRNPLGAEIHIVINDHGPLILDMTENMLNSYRGGCTDASLPPAFPATAKADGKPGPNTCRLVQVAIFQQNQKLSP